MTVSPAHRALLGLCAFCVASAVAHAARAATPPPEWRWRQVLSIPSIGGRLRTIAVDPEDPDRIFIGTEEGTVLRSFDGGVTWRELELGPVIIKDRSLGLVVPDLPELGETTENNFKVYVDPPDQEFVDRVPIPSAGGLIFIKPDYFFAGFLATSPGVEKTLLYDAVRSRFEETIPVKRIVICPGAKFPLLVATWSELFGSYDGGLTYIRLFSNPGEVAINSVVCSPVNPDLVAVATGVGLFTSRNGGLSFDQDLSAWPGEEATAVEFGPVANKGDVYLFSASGSELYAGDPFSKDGLSFVYPDDNPATAPWRTIRWIAATPRGDIWLATSDGARVSHDRGETWETVARTLLNRQTIYQVAVGENERGQERVVVMLNQMPVGVLHDSYIYASDDGGETWHPFFHGLSRRRFREMAAVPSAPGRPASWWVVTSGEVWTTAPYKPAETPIDRATAAWAQEKLRATPPLAMVLDAVLDTTGLSNEKIASLNRSHRALNWVPRLDMEFYYGRPDIVRDHLRTGDFSNNVNRMLNESGREVSFFVQASWDIKDVLIIVEDLPPTRSALHELRRQIGFAAEDAWHERRQHLLLLSEGLSDPIQIGTLKTRVEAIDAMIKIWAGRTIEEIASGS